MIIADDLRLPRVDELPPNLVLMMLGRALAQESRDITEQPLPEGLARIVRRMQQREPADAGR